MQRLKASRYNFVTDLENGSKLVYNALSGALVEAERDTTCDIDEILADPNQEHFSLPPVNETIGTLKEAKILLPSDFDEINYLKFKNRMGRFNSIWLEMLITLTYDCNFRCLYCSETLKKIDMSPETAGALVRFAKTKIVNEGIKRFSVGWYGGEPLLRKDLIYGLSGEFLKLCNDHGVRYRATVTTNGYLLDDEFIGRLVDMRIGTVIVTLDGPARIHDKRRFLKGGGPTYDVIKNNLRKIASLHKETVALEIRTNLDTGNISAFGELLDDIEEFREFGHLSWSYVSDRTGRGKKYSHHCFNDDFIHRESPDPIYKLLIERGYMKERLPDTKTNFCMGDARNGFAIDPEGKVYKCNAGVTGQGEYGKPIAFLRADGEMEFDEVESLKWYSWDAFDDDECRECKLLPICMGGCPLIAIHGGQIESLKGISKQCIIREYESTGKKSSLVERLKSYYHHNRP